MSIGFTFTGRVKKPELLIAAAKRAADERYYGLSQWEDGLNVSLCPLDGRVRMSWKKESGLFGQWQVTGECVSTPAGAGLHRAAVELVDSLPIRSLTVKDETGFYRHRDFQKMKEEHFYPWLRALVDICARESGRGVSGMQLCWDLEQYAPEDIPDTVVTPMGRFRLAELVSMVERGGVEALAGRFFLWDGRTQDARFYRGRAVNALWEHCCFAPSARSWEDEAVNAAILDDLERAAQMSPSLPLPRAAYEEVCALAGREPALPQGPELQEEFSPGYRKGFVTHALGALRLTLPGTYLYSWERWDNGGGTHLWSGGEDTAVWRVNAYRAREGDARFTDHLNTLHGVEGRELKGGALRWGWREIREEGEILYQAQCEVIAGPELYFLTATCSDPIDLGQVAGFMGRISVVSRTVRKENIQAR